MTDLTDAVAVLRSDLLEDIVSAAALETAVAMHKAKLQERLQEVARIATLAGQGPPVPPTSDPLPPGTALIRVGGSSYPLAAINPTPATNPAGAPYDGCRGPDQLVAYRPPVTRTGTNQYGAEVAVIAGRTASKAIIGVAGGIDVPTTGYVLSGHGKAAAFLAGVGPGVVVEALPGPTPPPPGPPIVVEPAGRTLGVYMMDGVGHISQIPPQCNRILVAFYQGTDLVEWGGDSPSTTAAALSAWRSSRAGNQVLISLGGQGGTVDLNSVAAGIARINGHFPVDGIDWDAESFDYSPGQAVSVSKACAAAVGRDPKDFVVSFVPPGGSPVSPAMGAAVDVKAAGFTVSFGQQLYETDISDSDVIGATGRAVTMLGAKSVTVGMMLGDSHNSWTVDSAESRMRQVVQRWPDIAGAYVWESSRPGTAEWARRVGSVLGLAS